MQVSAKNTWVTIALLLAGGLLLRSTVIGQYRVSSTAPMKRPLIHQSRITEYANPSSDTSKLPSPSKAAFWSATTTYVPIAAGVIILALQKPEPIAEYDFHYKDPDPTVAYAMIASGILIGPSTGYFYGGCANRGADGILLRVITGTVTVVAACAVARSTGGDGWDFSGYYNALAVAYIGAGIVIFEAAYDLAKVKSTVREHNEKRSHISITLGPKIYNYRNAPGLEFRVMF